MNKLCCCCCCIVGIGFNLVAHARNMRNRQLSLGANLNEAGKGLEPEKR